MARAALLLVAIVALLIPLGCGSAPTVRAGLAYSQMQLSGVASRSAANGAGGESVDVQDELGLSEPSASPYLSADIDARWGRVSASGFYYHQDGRGTLQNNFGQIDAGTMVDSDAQMTNIKAFYAYDVIGDLWSLGPFRLAPGAGVDYFAIDTEVSSVTPLSVFESFDLNSSVPMLFVEAGIDVPYVTAEIEAGWMSANLSGVNGTFWDVESRISVTPPGMPFEVFAGYRFIDMNVDGLADGSVQLSAELQIQGWFLGGAFRF